VLARRRLLAAGCVGVAAAAGVHEVAGPPPPTVAVTTVVRDLPAGTLLRAADLESRPLPPDAVPAGATPLAGAVGEVLAAPVRAGESLTDVRLVGDDLAAAHPDLATLPVRLPDAAQAALLDPGDRIDLVATDPQAGGSRVVAPGALVLAVPPPRAEQASATPGALVVLGVPPLTVEPVSEAAARWYLSYAYAR
jgi:Flp pilus assembly protein CpaB